MGFLRFWFINFKLSLNFSRYRLIYTYLESARGELSNDTHIDYIWIWTGNFEKLAVNGLKYRKLIDRCKHSQYGYHFKDLDKLILKMYILSVFLFIISLIFEGFCLFLLINLILDLTLLISSQYQIIYTFLESADQELSNDTHIDYVCIDTKNVEKINENIDK